MRPPGVARARARGPGWLQLFRARGVKRLTGETTIVRTQTEARVDPTEFTTFMRAHQDRVFSTAARLAANDAQAEDIAQETFVKAYERFEDLRGNPAAGGWLKTVATNLAINHWNRYRRRWRFFGDWGADREEPGQAPPDPPAAETPIRDALDEERRASIAEALRRLPAHQRIPLVLFHYDDLSYDEIAARLNCSLAKVKTDIRRARTALLPLLRQLGVDRESLENAG